MKIQIARPVKTETRCEFSMQVSVAGDSREVRTGFESRNFAIPHHEVWDAILPLMFVTRNGGPVFNRHDGPVRVALEYPVPRLAAEFFEDRARDFGLDIEITSPRVDVTYDLKTSGEMVLFGGGKDSRLLLGSLRELGRDPAVACAEGATYARDIEGARVYDTIGFAMPARMVPGMMLLPRIIHHGSGLGEIHQRTPWQQYFDISAPPALARTNRFLAAIGIDTQFVAPQCILPYNLVQAILARRYPELYAGQVSISPGSKDKKNLHVSLLKRYHGLSHDSHCDEPLFRRLLDRFLARNTSGESPFEYRESYEVIAREMRAILYRLQARGDLGWLAAPVPAAWDAGWIDTIHTYAYPGVDPDLLAIYRNHARDFDVADKATLPAGLAAYLEG